MQWGPQAGGVEPASTRRRSGCATSIAIAGALLGFLMLGGPPSLQFWGLIFLLGAGGYLGAPAWRRRNQRRRENAVLDQQPDALLAASDRPLVLLRDTSLQRGGGVFLGLGVQSREWITAHPEQAVMVLGPPRSGKTSSVIIPAVLSAPAAVVSTSTKLDVLHATAGARSMWGQVWLFDPSGQEEVPAGVRRLRWSPVDPRGSWDDSLTVSRAMVGAAALGTGGDSEYWNERAGALLAGLLRAATVEGRGIRDVRAWVLREELDVPTVILENNGEDLALDVLQGVARTGERTASGIFSTASSVLSAYNSEAALRNCESPNFDSDAFVASTDTLYVSAPAHQQARLAPLVVGLLEQIRNSAYARARRQVGVGHGPPLFWALDEVANIAPLSTLPALVSEGGGQGLQVMACFQDLSQARHRWGTAADGFLSLFGAKMIFAGIGDIDTLRAISGFIGTWDRPYTSVSHSTSKTRSYTDPLFFGSSRTSGVSTTTSVQREAILTEGDIAQLPPGHALLLLPGYWGLVHTEPYFASRCWQNVRAHAPQALETH